MKKLKNFIQYMKENKFVNKESSHSMVCPDCDGSGYTKDKNNKSKSCTRCKGGGLLYNKKEKK